MGTNIWWIRRDLRLKDNQALHAAVSSGDKVLPVFILDPILINSPKTGAKRLAFLFSSLAELEADLKALGGRLVIRAGAPAEVLQQLVKESEAQSIFAEADYSPYARRRDRKIAEQLPLELAGSPIVSHPRSILTKNGDPYKVFTPYMRNWKARYRVQSAQLLAPPKSISTPGEIWSDSLPEPLRQDLIFKPGEREANKRLNEFIDQDIYQYAEQRNMLDAPGTSRISAYLRFGSLSIRECIYAAQQAKRNAPDEDSGKSADAWLTELIWREFYNTILYHYPNVLKQSFKEDLRDIPWRNDAEEFTAWCEGRTGYPVVDAAMRQLVEIGWMHNRGRMITASFLVKDLVIDWRWGEKFFLQNLIDADPAANNGGWQWTAGTGTDAAPYFRVFNPVLQGKKFDPQGEYIRRWVPELSQVPGKYIHTPWEMPLGLQKQSMCVIGQDYPHPIVEHRFARQRILDVYRQAKLTTSP